MPMPVTTMRLDGSFSARATTTGRWWGWREGGVDERVRVGAGDEPCAARRREERERKKNVRQRRQGAAPATRPAPSWLSASAPPRALSFWVAGQNLWTRRQRQVGARGGWTFPIRPGCAHTGKGRRALLTGGGRLSSRVLRPFAPGPLANRSFLPIKTHRACGRPGGWNAEPARRQPGGHSARRTALV